MKSKLKFLYFLIVLMLFVGLLLTNFRESLLLLQNLAGVPGDQFSIGSAVISKPHNWLLYSSRSKSGDQIDVLGFLPSWLARDISGSTERYFSFRKVTRNGVSSHITFIEITRENNEKVAVLIQDEERQRQHSTESSQWRRVHVKGWDALIHESTEPQYKGLTSVYIPTLQINIKLTDVELLKDVSISSM